MRFDPVTLRWMPRDSETYPSVSISGTPVVDTELAPAQNANELVDIPATPPVIAGGYVWDSVAVQWRKERQGPQPATLAVTNTAAVNTGVTATLPAAGAGLFHYITAIEVVKLYSVVGVAAGAGVIITSTNLPGNPAWTTEQNASPAGTAVRVVDWHSATPLKSLAANTATTIVAPAQLQTIWRINVAYYTGPAT